MFGSDFLLSGAGVTGFYPKTIDQSLRFNDNDSAYLSRTPSTEGNRQKWTLSMWVKRGNLGTHQFLFDAFSDDNNRTNAWFWTDNSLRFFSRQGGTNDLILYTNQVFRDPSAWYHLVFVADFANGTSGDRAKIYVNGQRVTSFSSSTYPADTKETWLSYQVEQKLGASDDSSGVYGYFDGYMAEVNFVNDQALTGDSFGETKSGVWIPKAYSGSYGTNGFYLDFASPTDIGNDVSGNNNDWTSNNFTASDVVLDSPTDNFCTWNPLDKNTAITLSDGNLIATSATADDALRANFEIPSIGKWYFEMKITVKPNNSVGVGIARNTTDLYTGSLATADPTYLSGANYSANDVIGIAVNADTKSVTFYVNGTETAATATATWNDGDQWFPYVIMYTASSMSTQLNCGQLGFDQTPPTDFNALSTANLPDPVIDPAQDSSPEDYFNTVLYTGDNTTNHAITGVGFQPDMVWVKGRNEAYYHRLTSVGLTQPNYLATNATDAEGSGNNTISSLDSDGFTVDGTGTGGTNESGINYVAWNWKANGSGVSNTDGSITSTVSANTTSGFSVVSYTGSTNESVGHGLDQAPECIIVKDRDASSSWAVYHQGVQDITANGFLELNSTAAVQTGSNPRFLSGTAGTSQPTSTVFYVNNYSGSSTNNTGNDYIAYCFHSVEGFSKFGSYVGGSDPFVYLGFRPAFVCIKTASTTNPWIIQDAARDAYNPSITWLQPNSNTADQSSATGHPIDFLSNGFKIRGSSSDIDGSGVTYIYMAFAENPFKYSTAR